MLVMLNVLSHFDLTQYAPLSVERLHLEAEAGRVGYMMREMHIADPQHVDVDVARILAKEFAAEFAAKIRMDRMLDLPNVWPRPNPSTIYCTVVDKDRNACSFINSIAHPFGSGIMSNKIGVLMQNRGVGFRVEPGHPNCIAPGKRPLHTIIPCMVTKDRRAAMSFGVMGGQYQPVGQSHVLSNMLDFGMDVQEAIDLPRALHYDGIYQLEEGIPESAAEGLRKIGHQVTRVKVPWGGGQAIWIDWERGALVGGSDPRKDGCALGY
jgi:gamma-glutamyltranspeptidase/glutathione hydrolase